MTPATPVSPTPVAFRLFVLDDFGLIFDYPVGWGMPERATEYSAVGSPDGDNPEMFIVFMRGDPADLSQSVIPASADPEDVLRSLLYGIDVEVTQVDRFEQPAWEAIGQNQGIGVHYILIEYGAEWIIIGGVAPSATFEQFETGIFAPVVESLTILEKPALPTLTPTLTALPLSPTPSAAGPSPTVAEEATLPAPTYAALPPTPTLPIPTSAPTRTSSAPTPPPTRTARGTANLPATATAIIRTATAQALASQSAPPTLNALALTSTQLGTELALMVTPTFTVTPTFMPSQVSTSTPSRTPTVTPDFGATATSFVTGITATAAAQVTGIGRYQNASFGVAFEVPDGWKQPYAISDNALYLTDGSAEIYFYRGDESYFAAQWGIPAGEDDPLAAAQVVADEIGGTVEPYDELDLSGARLIGEPDDPRGVLTFLALEDGAWLIASASFPADDFDTALEDTLPPLLDSLEILAYRPALTSTPMPTRSPTSTVSPTPQPTLTPVPTLTLLELADGTLALTPIENPPAGLRYAVPENWIRFYIEDEVNVQGDRLYADPEDRDRAEPLSPMLLVLRTWDTGFDADTPEDYVRDLGNLNAAIEPYGGLDYPAVWFYDRVQDSDSADMLGIAYFLQLGDDDWLTVLLFAPGYTRDDVDALDEGLMRPILESFEVVGVQAAPYATWTPGAATLAPTAVASPDTPTLTPSPSALPPTRTPILMTVSPGATRPVTVIQVDLDRFESEALGLAFDAPSGWTQDVPQERFSAVLFYSNAEDVESGIPTAPAISVLRGDSDTLDLHESRTPVEALALIGGADEDAVEPYDALDFPAARYQLESAGLLSMISVVHLAQDDWIIVVLVAPDADTLSLMDEIVGVPLLRSLEMLDPLTATAEATEEASPTAAPK